MTTTQQPLGVLRRHHEKINAASIVDSFSSPASASSSSSTCAETSVMRAASSAKLASIYAKFDRTNAALDAQCVREERRLHDATRPTSPGLSPIRIRSLGRDAEDEHDSCDHSIHSIRPANLPAPPCNHAHVQKKHSRSAAHDRTSGSISSRSSGRPHITFADSAATEIRTRPSDLYQHASERNNFHQLVKSLWETSQQQQRHQQQMEKEQAAHQAIMSRSTMTTITSTPNFTHHTSIASASSSPQSHMSDHKSASSPVALWMSQIESWENRLCAWRDEQQAELSTRARELEQKRRDMNHEMNEQEKIYAARQTKFQATADKLEQRHRDLNDAVSRTATQEAELQRLMMTREKELKAREARFAKQRKEYTDNLASNQPHANAEAGMSKQVLQALTAQLTDSYEVKERQMKELFDSKTQKLSQSIQQNQARTQELQQREHDLAMQKAKHEAAVARHEQAVVAHRHEVSQRTERLNTLQVQEQVSVLEEKHCADLKETEAKWSARSAEWYEQRESLQAQIESLRAKSLESYSADTEATRECTALQGQVDKMHTRIKNLEAQLATARSKVSTLENESHRGADLEGKVETLEMQLESQTSSNTARVKSLEQQLSSARATVSESQAQYKRALTSHLESEVATLRKQFEVQLEEASSTHADQVKELEDALVSSKKETTSLELTLVTQNRTIDQLQTAAKQQPQVIERPLPVTNVASTCTSDLVDDSQAELTSAQGAVAHKSAIVAALQTELATTNRAFESEREQWIETRKGAERQMAQDITLLREEHAVTLAELRSAHTLELQKQRDAALEREAELEGGLEAQLEALSSVERREEVVQHQIAAIEAGKADRSSTLTQRESVVERRTAELAELSAALDVERTESMRALEARMQQHQKEQAIQEASWMKRQLELESALTKQAADASQLSNAQEALAALQAKHDESLETFRADRENFDVQEAELRAEHTAALDQVRESQERLDASLAEVQAEQATLAEEKAAFSQQNLDLQAMKSEVEEWKQHVQKRDQELTDAIAKFERHMTGRESSCSEWESRLHIVEDKYTAEFTKMSDEITRLSLWESELLTFQRSLQAREQHLNVVERNLSDYLSPFNDSALNSSITGDATPHKVSLTAEQRQRLQEIATPILSRAGKFHLASPNFLAAAGPSSSTSPSTTSPVPTQARAPVSPAMYSPTQAELSLLTDGEIHFTQPDL